jgi:hypothetical protein
MTPQPHQCRFENIATVVANLGGLRSTLGTFLT